jgi:hypothetical protein
MTSTCNPIFFYDNPTPGLSQILEKLSPYMHNKCAPIKVAAQIEQPIQPQPTAPHSVQAPPPPLAPAPVQETITPNHPDSLFWCIYILAHGYSDYIQIARNYGVKKLEINKEVMQYMQGNMGKFQETNVKMTKIAAQMTLSSLLTVQPTTNLNAALAMCIYYKFNLYFADANKKGLLKLLSMEDGDYPTYLIYKGENGIYSVDIEPLSVERKTEIETTMICLDSSVRPLKAISHYKLEELIVLAQRLNFYDCNIKYKKADLYKEVSEMLQWQ